MLTFSRLVFRNLVYHWRGNLAVLLGVAVGSAVLTGALLVGDSLRGSLRARAERQLGGIDCAALFPMPIRAAVANGMPGDTAPALLMPGSIQTVSDDEAAVRSLGRVTIIGMDARFAAYPCVGFPELPWNGSDRIIVLSHRVAERLGAQRGDRVRIGVERVAELPRSSALARRSVDDVTTMLTFTVAEVLPADSPGNDFNLSPSPAAALNVYVPLDTLSGLVQNDREVKANALFSRGASIASLDAALQDRLETEDFGIRFREVSRRGYLSVESERLIIPQVQVDVILAAAADLELRAEPTVVYVVDTIAAGDKEIPYPVIAGLNVEAKPPLGPFLPKGVESLEDNEIVLLTWTGSALNGLPEGTKLRIAYFNPEVEGEGKLEQTELTLRGYVPLAGATNDRDLTPPVRGMTDDRSDLRNWDRPPMLKREVVQARVPDSHPRAKFWNSQKATPMAYVNFYTAENLFRSRYGSITSIRVAADGEEELEVMRDRLRAEVMERLDAREAGLVFTPIRENLYIASRGGNDFGMLFLAFSCFLIAAALTLVALLFRLSLDRRAKGIGLLLATGYRQRRVLALLLAEGSVIALVGTLIGMLIAVWYNDLLLQILLSLWPDDEVRAFLQPHATPLSFGIGFGLTMFMALASLWLSVRGLVKVPPPALLRGETTRAEHATRDRSRLLRIAIIASLVCGLASLLGGRFVANPDFQAMTFFTGGGLLLFAGLASFWLGMKRTRHSGVHGRGLFALTRLGMRNASRNPTRSLLTAALLASAAFLLVAVESFRRQPGAEFLDKDGGSGGFNLLAETDVPLFEPLDPAKLDGSTAFALRLRPGDDASCLNLFRATKPRVLGVPESLIERGGFKFYQTLAETDEEKANPWLLLNRSLDDGATPAFVENNTAVWMLKTSVGGTVSVPDDAGHDVKFRIVGTFVDSPFQSELLVSDAYFKAAFPADTGYRVFLVETLPAREEAVGQTLQNTYRANGLIATPTKDRVAAYQAVIGAYLSTFQLLGSFGLLLGVFGLAVVVLRGVWERLGELALLRAVGYRTRELQFLVLVENAFLLVVGLGTGIFAALASVAPHVLDGASIPWAELLGMLAVVFLVGLGVASVATAGILRVPVIPALRRE